jgi:hypothetical protein
VTPRRRLLNPPVQGCETRPSGPTLRQVKRSSRMRLGTEEDMLRGFGPDSLLIGIPVRPQPEDEQLAEDGAAPDPESEDD